MPSYGICRDPTTTQALYEEYFSRLTQHKQLEFDLVVHMQKRHQYEPLLYCSFTFAQIIPH